MKSRLVPAFGPFLIALLSGSVWAQLDPTTAVLIRPNGRGPSPQSLDNSRYKIRTPELKHEDLEEQPGTMIPSPVPKSGKLTKAEKAKLATEESVVKAPEPHPPIQNESIEPLEEKRPPPVTVQVRQLILGGSDEDIDEAKRQIHPEDPRANILNISIAPAYFYSGSSSNYSFRNHYSSGPGLALGMSVWATPFFGLQSRYFASVSSAVKDAGTNVVPMTTSEFEAGIRFRRHFGYSRKSAQLSWGIDYHDSMNKISKNATTSIGNKTSGISVALEGVIPTSITYAHLFDIAIRPFQHHSEMSTTIEARSGSKNETNAVAMSLGGQWTLDRRNQVFWKAEYSVERNLFSGDSTVTDPNTNSTPNGVSVTNSLAIFYFGFNWGS